MLNSVPLTYEDDKTTVNGYSMILHIGYLAPFCTSPGGGGMSLVDPLVCMLIRKNIERDSDFAPEASTRKRKKRKRGTFQGNLRCLGL